MLFFFKWHYSWKAPISWVIYATDELQDSSSALLIHAAPSSLTFPPLEICNYHSLGMKTAALRPEGRFSSMLAHDRKSVEAVSLSTESQWELGMASWASRPLFPSLAPGCAGGGRWKANPRTSEGHKAEYLCCRESNQAEVISFPA